MEGKSNACRTQWKVAVMEWGNDCQVLTAERERERSAWSDKEGPTVGT